jgi:glycosyltransferase involved in cell wall biosynthesis
MTVPLVSIVTPVLNGARHLPDCLASVRAQSHPRVEHIVVDGGSTDGTLAILRAATGIRWTSGPDGGMYEAINRGFRMAEGQVLAYQNADDRYAGPDAVARAVAVLEAEQADVVYGGFRYVDADGRPLPRPEVGGRPFDRAALLRYNFIPPHSTFVRASIVKDEGLWLDGTLRYPGDWDWFVRIALAGKRFAHVPEVLSEFRVHEGSQTSRTGWLSKVREWRRVCRKNGTSFPVLVWYEMLWMPLKRRVRSADGSR